MTNWCRCLWSGGLKSGSIFTSSWPRCRAPQVLRPVEGAVIHWPPAVLPPVTSLLEMSQVCFSWRPSLPCEHDISKLSQGNVLHFWFKRSVGLVDELIQFWWSKVKGKGHCDLVKQIALPCERDISGTPRSEFYMIIKIIISIVIIFYHHFYYHYNLYNYYCCCYYYLGQLSLNAGEVNGLVYLYVSLNGTNV